MPTCRPIMLIHLRLFHYLILLFNAHRDYRHVKYRAFQISGTEFITAYEYKIGPQNTKKA